MLNILASGMPGLRPKVLGSKNCQIAGPRVNGM